MALPFVLVCYNIGVPGLGVGMASPRLGLVLEDKSLFEFSCTVKVTNNVV